MSYIKITLEEVGPMQKLSEGFGVDAQINVHIERLMPEEIPPMLLSAFVTSTEKANRIHGSCSEALCAFNVLYMPLAKEMAEKYAKFELDKKTFKLGPGDQKLLE